MRRLFHKKGQSTMEYAIVVGLVIAAVIIMQTYIQRGLTGKITRAVRNIGAATTGNETEIYEPYYAHRDFGSTTPMHTKTEATSDGGGFEEHMGVGGGSQRQTTRTGTSGVRSWTEAD